ncbi:BEM_collapsed_G0022600.mRNA.1.CDS.1 [Saccharomyces cerevisiae]|nr:BEM_collapsed_G0022600.mRNA.1.CDS.1 [Saccharomyces cerevisiae]
MSEKFPPLEDQNIDFTPNDKKDDDTDFLKREAEILGDEFKTEQDDILETEASPAKDDDEIRDFEEQFQISTPQMAQSRAIKMVVLLYLVVMTMARQMMIFPHSKVPIRELQDEAIKHIDDFYDSYNKKKEQQLEDAAKEAEAFLKKRDEFFGQDNTTWDRALQLINQDDADIIGGRDRSKFKEILLRLKGNAKAPGA